MLEYTAQGTCSPQAETHAEVCAAVGSTNQYTVSLRNPFPDRSSVQISTQLDCEWCLDTHSEIREFWLDTCELVEIILSYSPNMNSPACSLANMSIECSCPTNQEDLKFSYKVTGSIEGLQPLQQYVLQTQPHTRIQQVLLLTLPRQWNFDQAQKFYLQRLGQMPVEVGEIELQVGLLDL